MSGVLVSESMLKLRIVVVTSWTGVLLGQVHPLTAISSPVTGLCVLALAHETFINRSVGTGTRIRVFVNVQVSRPSSEFVLHGSLSKTVFLGRLGWGDLVVAGSKVSVEMLHLLSGFLLLLGFALVLLILFFLFSFV